MAEDIEKFGFGEATTNMFTYNYNTRVQEYSENQNERSNTSPAMVTDWTGMLLRLCTSSSKVLRIFLIHCIYYDTRRVGFVKYWVALLSL